MRWMWMSLGLVCVAVGGVGTVLPLVPTTPLLLVAVFCFARSSGRLHNWLVDHPTLGPPIADWRRQRAIRRSAKLLATASIAAAMGVPTALGADGTIVAVQAGVLAAVLAFIWTRPEPRDRR